MALDARIITADTRARYATIRAAALLESVEAAFMRRVEMQIWRPEARLGRTDTDPGRQFRGLVASAARMLKARDYEDFVAALHNVRDTFDVNINGEQLFFSVPRNEMAYLGVPYAAKQEQTTRFVLFAMNLYSEILAQPESATKFPPVKSTRAYQTWANGGSGVG